MQPAIKPQVASLGLPGLRPSCSPGLVNCVGSRVRNYQKVADMCMGNVERDGILWVTVVKKGKRYPPGGGDRDRLGKAGGVGVLLTCLLPGHTQPS